MKKVKLFLSLAISLLTIVGLTSKAHAVTHYVQFSTPTIFVHGWGIVHTRKKRWLMLLVMRELPK